MGMVLGRGLRGSGRLSTASSDKIETPMSDSPRDPHATYESPLAGRNASAEMLRLFSARHKFGLWRRLWLELSRAERELGVWRISDEALRQMEARRDDID